MGADGSLFDHFSRAPQHGLINKYQVRLIKSSWDKQSSLFVQRMIENEKKGFMAMAIE